MTSFAAAYSIVLLAVVLYVARLGLDQRRLARELEALRGQVESAAGRDRAGARAA